MKIIFLALIAQCCISFASVQAFSITRASHGRDAFKIPAPICKRNGTQSGSDCKSFYAVDGARDCSCMCPARNATFAFQYWRWSCVENRKLRRQLNRGRKILFVLKKNSHYLAFNRICRNKTLSVAGGGIGGGHTVSK